MADKAERKQRRREQPPAEGARFPANVVGDNLRHFRQVSAQSPHKETISQDVLASRMNALGWENWDRTTVSYVEKATRGVDVNELLALAVALEVSVADLLNPAHTPWTAAADFDLGNGTTVPAIAVEDTLHVAADLGQPTHRRLVWGKDVAGSANPADGGEVFLEATIWPHWEGGPYVEEALGTVVFDPEERDIS